MIHKDQVWPQGDHHLDLILIYRILLGVKKMQTALAMKYAASVTGKFLYSLKLWRISNWKCWYTKALQRKNSRETSYILWKKQWFLPAKWNVCLQCRFVSNVRIYFIKSWCYTKLLSIICRICVQKAEANEKYLSCDAPAPKGMKCKLYQNCLYDTSSTFW